MKADKKKYSKARPKIEQSDLAGGDFTVVTVTKFEEIAVEYDKDKRLVPALTTEEFGDKVLWLNATQVGYLIDRLGNETDRWAGKRVPVVKSTAQFGSDRFEKVTVAIPEEWDDLLAMAGSDGVPAKRRRAAAAPARPKKRGK
jgi:hypothetical protein